MKLIFLTCREFHFLGDECSSEKIFPADDERGRAGMDLIATEENTVQCRVEFEYIISNIKEELERFRDTPRQNGVFNPFTLLCKDLVIGSFKQLTSCNLHL